MRDLPTGALTFVFTDVEGSTKLLEALGSRYVAVHGDHQRLVRAAVGGHDGIEVSTEGDGFFLVFRHASHAALAAAEIATAIERHSWPEDGRVRIRIGIHSGRAVLASDDYVGIDVNRAARIAAAANGGQILMSEATAVSVRDATASVASIRDLGRYRLKDIGPQQLYRLEPVGLVPDERPPRTLEAAPSNLPTSARGLVDRDVERERLNQLLMDDRVVTVTGAGGIGKTALAIEVANSLRGRFIDGIGFVDLAAVEEVEAAASILAEGLGFPRDPERPASTVLVEELRGRDVLLVVETAEHLPSIRDFLADAVRNCPRLRILVTSRVALHLKAESELRLDPLPALPAAELFVTRARGMRPGFVPTEEEDTTITTIAERLDGLPLAIELAAARIRLLSPAQILERLDKRLPVLTGGAADAPSRQRTLRATVEWSYQQLTDDERALLETIAVFASDFDLEAVENVAGRIPRGIESEAVLDLLEGLVDQSLVYLRDTDSPRFRLLTAIREFALEELAASGYGDATRSAHAGWVLELARTSAAAIDSPVRTVDDEVPVRAHEDDLRAALAWSLASSSRPLEALEIAAAAGPFWYAYGRALEGSTWLERAIATAPAGRDEVHGDAHFWAGVLADERRQPQQAIAHLELSLELRRELGDGPAISRTINSLGVVTRTAGDLVRARDLLTESLERKRAANDPRVGSTLTNLAIVAVDEGHLEEALGLFLDALEVDRGAGATKPHPAVLLGIALVHVRRGQPERAIEPVLAAAADFVSLEDDVAVAECLDVLVEAWQESRPGAALPLFQASESIRRATGIRRENADEQHLQAIAKGIRAALSDEELTSLMAEGDALDASGAVAYAAAIAGLAAIKRP